MLCTAFPTLASTMLPRLYEAKSFVRTALISMGSVLSANRTVETDPAITPTLALSTIIRVSRTSRRYVGLNTHLGSLRRWVRFCRSG
jgi:hypothetical protein